VQLLGSGVSVTTRQQSEAQRQAIIDDTATTYSMHDNEEISSDDLVIACEDDDIAHLNSSELPWTLLV
jgi:hypothetical protein